MFFNVPIETINYGKFSQLHLEAKSVPRQDVIIMVTVWLCNRPKPHFSLHVIEVMEQLLKYLCCSGTKFHQ